MKNKSVYILIFLFLFHFIEAFTQEGTVIRGRVMDKSTGEPLPGVNIVEIDDQNRIVKGVITDVNGNFVLEVSNSGHQISISFLGYKKQVLSIDSKTQFNIELEQSTTQLEEVTVTAESQGNELTGVSDRDKTGSSVRVDMEKLSGEAGLSAASALQGQVSGLDIVAASGAPGSGSSIVIRGMGSIGNANPLIVVDGIPQDLKTDDFNFASADQHDLGQLLSIAPQDIESVEVLKDASSTAVWGTKGANGVLLIETQKGSKGKITFNYQYKLSANIQPSPIPMLNGDEYITLQMEEWHNAEGIYDIPPEIAYDRNYVDFHNYSANTDWIGELTRDSWTHDHFFKISGGGSKSRYYTSISYQDEAGTTINTGYQRFSVRANFDYNISDKLRFTTNFNYTNSFRENSPETTQKFGNKYRNMRWLAYRKAPNMSIWEYDENGNPTGDYFTPIESYQGSGDRYWNPVAIANLGRNDVQGNQVQNNFKLNYSVFNWMRLRETISFSYSNDKGNKFIPSTAIGTDWLYTDNNKSDELNRMDLRWLSRTQMFLTPFINQPLHSMTGVLMWEMEQKSSERMRLVTEKSPSIYIADPANGAPENVTKSVNAQSRLFGALASLNYKLMDKYILNANLRADGSSAFGVNNQWGYFPSFSFGWRFSEENFLSGFNFLGESKIRVSWGQAGDAIDENYATYSYYENTGQYGENPVIVPTQIQLSNLKWQTVTSWNIGIDINLFNERLYMTADVYDKVTKDLLWKNYDIPGSSGYNRLGWLNGGELQNQGWELFLRGSVIQRENLEIALNANISQNINSFKSFPINFQTERATDIGNGQYPRKAEVGKPIGSFYGFRYLGVYATDADAVARDENGDVMVDARGNPILMSYNEEYEFQGGDAIYEDINHDGKIDIMDAVYIGNSSPEVMGGFGTSVTYGQFSSSVHFHYRLGFDIVNEVASSTQDMLGRNNQSKAVLKRWKRPGQSGEGILPRAYLNHPANNLGSDRYVEVGDFLRLNSIDFNYRITNQQTLQRLNLNSISVGINIRNVLTFTNYSGQDPEIGRVGKNPFFLGTDNARTPPPRIYALRINLTF